MALTERQQQQLFAQIKQTIQSGLQGIKPAEINIDDPQLAQPAATFVTLHLNGQLRGCIGSLQAQRPLIEDIAHNAFSAAFRDPRFEALTAAEVARLQIECSILTPPEPIRPCESKQQLIAQLQPHHDGLILADETHRATFLPSVWEQLPDAQDFVDYLMRKAGMVTWSPHMQCQRYSVVAYQRDWASI